ncbi:MAG: potassium transporter [Desulfosarcina sp.]|nr:potassium transporter [Desulfosarcina sp.]
MNNNKDQRDIPLRPKCFWIIGAGRFGQIAVERITRHISGAAITVVDKKPITIDNPGITAVNDDGIGWLNRMLDQDAPVDMIVPAIPVHVAAEWLSFKLLSTYEINAVKIPDSWLTQMPNAFRGKTGQAFVSHADFICPDNCPEPEKICTHTGKPRPKDLFRLLADLNFDDVLPIVLRSHQLLPGVGGIYPADLMAALETACKNSHRPLMIGTACRCHR